MRMNMKQCIYIFQNGSGFAKVELKNLKVVQDYFKPKDLKMALKIVK